MNGICDMLMETYSKKMLSESERYIIDSLNLTRLGAFTAAAQGRISCAVEPSGHCVYAIDGEPFLRMGPLAIEERKLSDPPQIAFTCRRTIERITPAPRQAPNPSDQRADKETPHGK